MMDFNERVIPGVSANFLYKEALARYEFALQFIKPSKRVLDLGCGTGYGSALLGKEHEVVGVDIDKEAIHYAKKHYGKFAKFMVGDVMTGDWRRIPDLVRDDNHTSVSGEKFDAVCSFEVIEHLNKPEVFLKSAVRLLKPNGIMILSTPNADIPTPENSTRSKYHTKEYTRKEFEQILRKVFKNVELFGQEKDKKAKEAFEEFMKSQSARQQLVNSDKLNIRKYIPKELKEFIWKYMGSLFGRKAQDDLETKNFPITKDISDSTEYFLAICQK